MFLSRKMKPHPQNLRALFYSIRLQLLFFTLNMLCFSLHTTLAVPGNQTDHLTLLKFKESISKDPYGILASWNSSTQFCNWTGITCDPIHQRVTKLNLQGYELNGSISPYIGNLSFLRNLSLQDNNFYGGIPRELGWLFQLQQLSLVNNSLEGQIPTTLTNCSYLELLNLRGNKLTGKIPPEIGSLKRLQILSAALNNLTGEVPLSIGNLSSLNILSVPYNNLEGQIPLTICHLKNLTRIGLGPNNLSGAIPSCVYNMSSLIIFSIPNNQIHGSLPSNLFNTLPNIQRFLMSQNRISGPIPGSLENASFLQMLDITKNQFVGNVPSLGKLQHLEILNMDFNNLGNNSTSDLDFLKSLTNSSKLQRLTMPFNNFGGNLPNSLGNLSTQLTLLYFGSNQISGKIPASLGNLKSLISLTLDHNHFDGIVPITFGNFQNMQLLDLSANKLSGEISAFVGNLSRLFRLGLAQNMFEGTIPPSIGGCQKLQILDLSQNNLRGPIPIEVFSLSSLTNLLDLSQNSLSGSLPNEVGRLKNIEQMDVSENRLYGDIPGTVGECISLVYLFLQGNSFQGIIPSSLASLKGLRQLDLSRNNLSGPIPEDLQNISVLEYLNVSFNMLEGKVPTEGVFQNRSEFAVTGNDKLCGGIPKLHLPLCLVKGMKPTKHHNLRLIGMIIGVSSFLLILLLVIIIYWMKKRNKKPYSDTPTLDSPTIDQLPKVSYQNLHNGTDGFSARNLIGSGNFGSVYNGNLESWDKIVAIKVLNLQKKGAHKSFIAECNVLKNIRHRNLVKILSCCSSTDYKGQEFKALVFEYMTNGSLESWLHPAMRTTDQSRKLDLEQRLNIIIDVASAFHYLHYECEQAIIHCDLKPSNVLLDDNMVAHVTDFGLARLLSSIGVSVIQSSTIGIKGTIGYAPPEYGMGSEMSMEGDMYSFGIMILEMLTGKRPTDDMFKDGHNLYRYVDLSFPNDLWHIIDPTILPRELEQVVDTVKLGLLHPNVEKCLLSLFRIALACSVESPKERLTMVDVTKELDLIKNYFTSKV